MAKAVSRFRPWPRAENGPISGRTTLWIMGQACEGGHNAASNQDGLLKSAALRREPAQSRLKR